MASKRAENQEAGHEAAMMLYVTIRPMFSASHDGAPLEIRRELRRALNIAYATGIQEALEVARHQLGVTQANPAISTQALGVLNAIKRLRETLP